MRHQSLFNTTRNLFKVVLPLTLLGASLVLAQTPTFKILDFTGVGGFAHGSRTPASALIDSIGKAIGAEVVHSALASVFTDANLAQYKVLIMNNSTELGKIATTTEQRAAILKFIKTNGYLGFHGALDAKGTFPDYVLYMGGELSSHGGGDAKLNKDSTTFAKDTANQIIGKLLPQYILGGEWYAYKTNPRVAPRVQILYTLDESSCPNCVKMLTPDHPVAWLKTDSLGGRAFYMAMGHEDGVFKNQPWIKTLIGNSLKWAAKLTPPIVVSVHPNFQPGNSSIKSNKAAITVETTEKGSHVFELYTLSGKRIAMHKGNNSESYTFTNLRPSTVYTVVSISKTNRQTKMVAVQ